MTSAGVVWSAVRLSRKPSMALHPRTWKRWRSLWLHHRDCWQWIYMTQQIQGWLTDGEAEALFIISRDHVPMDSPVAVELGSWKGKSSVMIAAGLLEKNSPRLYCVDSFDATGDAAYEPFYKGISRREVSLEGQFEKNVSPVSHIVTPVRGYTTEVAQAWRTPIDFLFIDASHAYKDVLEDFRKWSPFIRVGGVIAFHDVCSEWPGPSRVVRENLTAPCFKLIGQRDSLAWARKLSEESDAAV